MLHCLFVWRWKYLFPDILGFGLILFALPHFIVGPYKPADARSSVFCLIPNTTINQDAPECKAPSGGEWYYMMIFIVAQLIVGTGLAPFHSFLPVYLDENVDPKSMPVYLGIWYIFTFLGPGIGYFFAGKFLSIYVDIQQVRALIHSCTCFIAGGWGWVSSHYWFNYPYLHIHSLIDQFIHPFTHPFIKAF